MLLALAGSAAKSAAGMAAATAAMFVLVFELSAGRVGECGAVRDGAS